MVRGSPGIPASRYPISGRIFSQVSGRIFEQKFGRIKNSLSRQMHSLLTGYLSSGVYNMVAEKKNEIMQREKIKKERGGKELEVCIQTVKCGQLLQRGMD